LFFLLLTFDFSLLTSLISPTPHPSSPIIVKLVDPPSELATLSDVLLGSLGLSGVLALLAILLGVALGGVMFWIRRRRET
jgi:hypothetical protein